MLIAYTGLGGIRGLKKDMFLKDAKGFAKDLNRSLNNMLR